MRIFSIHKSKSKKKISDKTPKLAAKKFFEKRKVGTVIYLYEHNSGKIHGPYRKEYDKKIMKGGLFGSIPSVSDFLVPSNMMHVLYGTKQLLINRPRKLITREPCIYFGDNEIRIHYNYNDIKWYYKYALINKTESYSNKTNISSQLRFFILNTNDKNFHVNTWSVQEVDINQLKNVSPEILLGLYIQYILRCKEDFPTSSVINYEILYMRRLFLHLLIHILPIITNYIMTKYFVGKTPDEINMAITKCNQIFTEIQLLPNNSLYYELYYFMNIALYVQNINITDLINEIANKYKLNQSQRDQIIRNLSEKIRPIMSKLQTDQTITQSNNQIIASIISMTNKAKINENRNIRGIPEKNRYWGVTGSKKADIALGIVFSPVILAGFSAYCMLAGLDYLIKMIQQQNNRSRNYMSS